MKRNTAVSVSATTTSLDCRLAAVAASRGPATTASAMLSLLALWSLVSMLTAGPALAQAPADQPVRVELVFSETNLKPDGQFVQITEQQFKIQTQAGLQQAGQMVFSYTVSMQKFEVLQAQTRKADGRVVDVKPEAIFTRDLPASTGAPMFADVKVVVIVFPEVALGDSIFARVRHEQVQPMFPGHYSNLAHLMPHFLVDEARVVLHAPKSLTLLVRNDGYTEKRAENADTVTYEWAARNDVVEPFEQGSVAPLDYSPRVAMSTFGEFGQFAQAYAGRAADKARVTPAVQKLADEVTAGAMEPREQARRLYDWVTQNVRYVGIFLGMGAVVPHAADQVLQNRYGDCKDHVTLLTALLAAKGIEARTAIVSLGNSFWVSKLPLLPNFNHVIVHIPSLDVWADPTAATTPFGRLPTAVQGKTAVLVPDGNLRVTPVDQHTDNVTVRHVRYEILDKGTVKATSLIEAKGMRAERYHERVRELSAEKLPQYVRDLTSGSRYKGEGTVAFIGADRLNDSLQVKAEYTLSGGIDWPGAGSFEIPAGFRGGEHMSTQIQPSAVALKRPRDGRGVETLIEEYEIRLPARMKISALPQNVNFRNEAASYEASYRRDGQVLYVTRKLVDLYAPPIKQPSLFKAVDEKSNAIARDLRAQFVYQTE